MLCSARYVTDSRNLNPAYNQKKFFHNICTLKTENIRRKKQQRQKMKNLSSSKNPAASSGNKIIAKRRKLR